MKDWRLENMESLDFNRFFLPVRRDGIVYPVNLLNVNYPEINEEKIVFHFNDRTTLSCTPILKETKNGLPGNMEIDDFRRLYKFCLNLGIIY